MSETGAVKFQCDHLNLPLAEFEGFGELQRCRAALRELRVLGVNSSGVGFGNVSLRESDSRRFYITGSNTGALTSIGSDHCARVTEWDIDRNWLRCEGRSVASSESLTHAAIYAADPTVRAVIHGHSAILWDQLRNRVPTTDATIDYGTPEMARALQELIAASETRARQIVIMAGHRDGFITFGASLADAFTVLAKQLSAMGAD